ncbi:hypothetical protein RhiirC2_825065 [Rhizophagus irregularis]|uniref:Uncharacterized protein n=1 Tax=Rhizophagus irregularis TaxID=588596 RepID=A0A2N1NG67_9GLOM|nr:hypothetical protein RhiirC2_825065 [Rhizophagus irregularis]
MANNLIGRGVSAEIKKHIEKACNLRTGGKTSFVDTFAVNIAKESNILGSLVKFDDLKISDLKYLIYNLFDKEINDTKFNYKNIGLWKVDIAYDQNYMLEYVTTKDDIKLKLGGELLIPIFLVKKFFENLIQSNIHVIVQMPAAAAAGSHKRLKMNRCFCSSSRLDPENNFYIRPKELVENLSSRIVEGKFCLFHGHRQSGKMTTAWELKCWIETNSKYTVYYLNFNSGIVTNEGLSEFWWFILFKLKSIMPAFVDKAVYSPLLKGKIGASAFEELINKDNTSLRDIILIIDEASKLINDNDETSWLILKEFIASLRVLRDQRGDISIVHSVVLIGTKDEDDVKFLLAEEMVIVISNYGDGMDFIGCAAPILCTIMLFSICGPKIVPSLLPTNTDHIDPKWLLARTIELKIPDRRVGASAVGFKNLFCPGSYENSCKRRIDSRYRTFSFGLRTLTSRTPATLGSSFILNFLNSGRYDRYQ